jgi:hypothetical protein
MVLRLALLDRRSIRCFGERKARGVVDLVQELAGEVDAEEVDLARAVEAKELAATSRFHANVDQAHIADGKSELERIEVTAQGPVATGASVIPECDHALQDRMLDPRQQPFNRPRHSHRPTTPTGARPERSRSPERRTQPVAIFGLMETDGKYYK